MISVLLSLICDGDCGSTVNMPTVMTGDSLRAAAERMGWVNFTTHMDHGPSASMTTRDYCPECRKKIGR
jgi:hypothetical protein